MGVVKYFLIYSLYTPYILPGHSLLCPKGFGRVTLKDIISGPLHYVYQNDNTKILIGYILRNGGLGRGLVELNHIQLSKRALALSIRNQMSCFQNFYDKQMGITKFNKAHFRKIRGVGNYPTSNHSEF